MNNELKYEKHLYLPKCIGVKQPSLSSKYYDKMKHIRVELHLEILDSNLLPKKLPKTHTCYGPVKETYKHYVLSQ